MPSAAETLTEVVHSSKQIKIQGFSLTAAMAEHEVLTSGKWKFGGYDWEVQVLPNKIWGDYYSVAINLLFRSEVRTVSDVNAIFSCRLIDPSGKIKP